MSYEIALTNFLAACKKQREDLNMETNDETGPRPAVHKHVNVKLTITGPPASGKTLILHAVEMFLREQGYTCKADDEKHRLDITGTAHKPNLPNVPKAKGNK